MDDRSKRDRKDALREIDERDWPEWMKESARENVRSRYRKFEDKEDHDG